MAVSYDILEYWRSRENPNSRNGLDEERIKFDANFIRLNTSGSAEVLELGPGTGRTFGAYGAGRKICTLDVTDNYSRALHEEAAKHGSVLNENFITDIRAPFPFEDDQFEYGVAFQVFIHQPTDVFALAFSELARTCKSLIFAAGIHANSPLSVKPVGDHVFAHDYLAAVEQCDLQFSNLTFRAGHLYGVTKRIPS